jgi:2-iminobutanoate/2-iminopropanoate deaminase
MAANLRFLNPATMSKPPGYSHVVEVTAPVRIVYIAGQLGLEPSGEIAGGGSDFHAQAVQVFENLKAALVAVGGSFEHVVKINNYLLDMAHLPIFREVRNRYVNLAAPPASTTIAISQFARDDALLEVEVVAILPPA